MLPGEFSDELTEEEKRQSTAASAAAAAAMSGADDIVSPLMAPADAAVDALASGASSGSASRISIRIPRRAPEDAPVAEPRGRRAKAARTRTRPIGRKRRGADSDDSAYSSADEEEESESDESSADAYSSASEESADAATDEDDDEEAYGRPAKKRARARPQPGPLTPRRHGPPPISIPISYTTSATGGVTGISGPLNPAFASIPMFARMRPLAPMPGAPGVAPMSPDQLQEMAKEAAASYMSRMSGGAGDAAPTPEALKEHFTSLFSNEEWRSALMAKLQANRALVAQQTASLGLTPAPAARVLAPGAPGVFALPGFYTAGPPPSHSAPRRPPKAKTTHAREERRLRRLTDNDVEVSDAPIALRRPRRAAASAAAHASEGEADEPEAFSDEVGSGSDDGVAPSERTGVEKLLSWRTAADGGIEVLVKHYNEAYLHAEWISADEFATDTVSSRRLKMFMRRPAEERHHAPGQPFNPEYTVVERVVAGWEHPDPEDAEAAAAERRPQRSTWSYLVKWRALPYTDATWEKRATVAGVASGGADALRAFEARPTYAERLQRARPPGWRPLPPPDGGRTTYAESPAYKGGHTLREYQLEGLNWLIYCWLARQSCIIADEMGLGKTVQSVTFVHHLASALRLPGPYLVVAPLSTLPHWEREFAAWTDLNVVTYHGSSEARDLIYEHEFFYRTPEDTPAGGAYRFDVLLTTYEMALAGYEHLQAVPWRVAVVDEAHRLKKATGKAAEALKTFSAEHKVLLTGTPLQNNLGELWALLNFMQPHRFVDEAAFAAEYGRLERSEDVARLQELLRPLMLRRLKEDVETSIPVKEETVVEVELTSVQKRYYRAILERNFAFLAKGGSASNAPNLLNAFMELRKCCIHPYLIAGAEERILEEAAADGRKLGADARMEAMVQASGKLVLVDKLLRKLRASGHRVLIFSQMTRCLDLLQEFVAHRGYPVERIDGAVRADLRQAAIDRFNDAAQDAFVFLLCTRAGGVGINLTAADTVVIFDSDWNPQNDIQAQARCHRIGQTKAVKVYRLITRGTYERDMFDKAGMKLGLDRAVLQRILPDAPDAATSVRGLDRAEVETLLKRGAYGVLMDTDEDAMKFCAEDIDQILERRTTVVKHGAAGDDGPAGSIFSKASFAATADDADISIDDPNFWELWARRLNMDPRKLLSSSGVSVDEPRAKRMARRLRRADIRLAGFDVAAACAEVPEALPVEHAAPRPEVPADVQPWTGAERAALVEHLVTYGVHRMDVRPEVHPCRSANDIVAAQRFVLRTCLEAVSELGPGASDAEAARFREDAERLLLANLDFAHDGGAAPGEDVRDLPRADVPYVGCTRRAALEYRDFCRSGRTPDLVPALQRHARALVLRVVLLDLLRQVVETHAGRGRRGRADLPVPTILGSMGVRGWSKACDGALVAAVYRRGYGRYGGLQAEEPFASRGFADPLPEADDADEDAAENEDSDDESAPTSPTNAGAADEADGQSSAFPGPRALGARLVKVVLAMVARSRTAAKLAVQALTAERERDAGRRRREERARPATDDDDAYEEAPGDDDDEYVGRGAGRGRGRGRGGRFALPGRGGRAGTAVRFPRRDRMEFIRCVGAYGLPPVVDGSRDWAPFRGLPGAAWSVSVQRAPDATFDAYAAVFLAAAEAAATRTVRRGRRAAGDESSGREEDVPSAADDSESDDAEAGADGSVLPVIPPDRARKALARISMFERLRAVIIPAAPTPDDLEALLVRARRSGGLPSWWVVPRDDASLLLAAARYGLSNWAAAVRDADFSFAAVAKAREAESGGESGASDAAAVPAGRKRRAAALAATGASGSDAALLASVAWPVDTVILRRVEVLVELALAELNRRESGLALPGDASPSKATGRGRGRPRGSRGASRASRTAPAVSASEDVDTDGGAPDDDDAPAEPPAQRPRVAEDAGVDAYFATEHFGA